MAATLNENLNLILSYKSEIKSAIEAKGVDMTNVPLSGYASAIGSISTAFVTETLSVSVNGTYTPGQGVDGFSEVVVDVPQSVTGFTEKDITERNIVITNLNNSASFVGSEAFSGNTQLQTVNLPDCVIVNNSAFANCSSLSQVNIPKVSIISSYAFAGCTSLKSIYAPECLYFSGFGQFHMCTELETVDFPVLYSMYRNTFASCYKLVSVSLPLLYDVYDNTFFNCSLLSEINLPFLFRFVSGYNFFRCSSLEKISLPIWYSLGYDSYQFGYCSSLKEVTIGTGLYIVPQYLSLGSDFIANNGVINIDAEMYDKWLSASGWSSMSAYFRSYVSTNSDPLLSVSDGVLYGRTKLLIQGQSSVDWKTYVSDAYTVVNVSLPECEVMGDCFEYLNNLRTIYLPKVKLIPYGLSFSNYSITSVYFGELEVMGTIRHLPQNCSVTIATSKVCKCLSSSAFYDYVPSVYVPASLVDAYKSAPAWSKMSSQIFPIPE